MRNLREELAACWHESQAGLPAAWRSALGGAEPCLGAVAEHAILDSIWVVPVQGRAGGPFYALDGIDPEDVSVVVIGDDPYPDPRRATGRSFEQGDLRDWAEGLRQGRVAPSLLSLARAAAALHPDAATLGLDGASRRPPSDLHGCAALLPSPRAMFDNLTGQGVLWINRTPTISVRKTWEGWQAFEHHRRWHRAFWRPITRAILSTVVGEARTRPIVFGLFGGPAGALQPQLERLAQALGVPTPNLRFVRSGHPSRPQPFFRRGNPLARVNAELTAQGRDPIDWRGPGASPPLDGARARAVDEQSRGASARSIAIMDRTVGKYRHTLRRLAER